jgi:hypothetical protein
LPLQPNKRKITRGGKMPYTQRQIRSSLNAYLGESKLPVLKKDLIKDLFSMVKHLKKIFDLDIAIDGRTKLKDKEYKQVLSKYIDSSFDLKSFVWNYNNLIISKKLRDQERQLNNRKAYSTLIYEEHKSVIGNLPSSKFYKTPEWRRIRYEALSKNGNNCQCCGKSPSINNITLHVDHIKPRSIYPEFALDLDNLQILCEECNLGKSNTYEDDWRAM